MRTRGQMAKARATTSSDEDANGLDCNNYSSASVEDAMARGLTRDRAGLRMQGGAVRQRGLRHRTSNDEDDVANDFPSANQLDEDAAMDQICSEDCPSPVAPREPRRLPYGGSVVTSNTAYTGANDESSIRLRRTYNVDELNPPPTFVGSSDARKGRVAGGNPDYRSSAADLVSNTTQDTQDDFVAAIPAARRIPHLPFETGIQAQGLLGSLTDVADYYVSQFPIVLKIAEPLGMRPLHVPLVAIALISLIMGVFDHLISNAIGFFYPAWQSFKAVESPSRLDDRQWLTYWVVYAFFSFVEIFGDYLLAWVPFYYLVKVLFLLWLFLPQTKGASVMYANFIRPFLLKYEDRIDSAINTMARNSQQLLKSTVATATAPPPPPPQQRFSAAATAKLKRVVFG